MGEKEIKELLEEILSNQKTIISEIGIIKEEVCKIKAQIKHNPPDDPKG